jgi:hypothetical protein
MSNNFQLESNKRNGNLYVRPSGDFDGSSAWELVNLLHEKYDGKGRIFIDTRKLHKICSFGCSTFQCRLNLKQVPVEQLYFKGENGYAIAPKGSRVLIPTRKTPCQCDGKCTNCKCKAKK